MKDVFKKTNDSAMFNDNDKICLICGHRFGDHRYIDNACPKSVKPHRYEYLKTKFNQS